jgi:hypothetical protein
MGRSLAMKPPRIRMSDVLEWVVALAVGMAVMRWVYYETGLNTGKLGSEWPELVSPTLAGIAIVEGLALALESATRHGPARWGLGRWAWATTGLYLLVDTSRFVGPRLPLRVTRPGSSFDFQMLGNDIASCWRFAIGRSYRFALPSAAIAFRWATGPIGRSPDAREWSGRLFTVFLPFWELFQVIWAWMDI